MITKKIAILFSGRGTNLEAILKTLHGKFFNDVRLEVALAITDNPSAGGIARARIFGIEPLILRRADFACGADFDAALRDEIKKSGAVLSVLAGFMRILSPVFTQEIVAINLHPSLLPLFKGANAIKRSFESARGMGVTVHYVSKDLDGGEIIAQRALPKKRGETLDEFEARIHALEHELLPNIIVDLLCY
ncbi:MAG: phosphoribosylglycinamide formyltransferase [Helicobacteraceae bacterium]